MKKNFVWFVVLSVCLFNVVACSNSNPKPEELIPIVDKTTSPLEVWRGRIVRVETRERWAEILVEDPGDNSDHKFMLNVMYRGHGIAPSREEFEGLKLMTGRELLFIEFGAFSERRTSKFLQGSCSLGAFIAFYNKDDVETRLIKIMNPPNKK